MITETRTKHMLAGGVALSAMIAFGASSSAYAQNAASAAPPAAAAQAANTATDTEVKEVVVTAQKRSERLQDVPLSISVLGGDQLQKNQAHGFQDYVATVPGLNFLSSTFGPSGSQLVVRGLSTGGTVLNSSVATYVDETPYVATGAIAAGLVAPDLDTFDMQRIEVLKGPQGTLYGASALGGLLKFVTNAPDPSHYSAQVETGVDSVNNGGAGYDIHAMVNIPVASNAALRLVGYNNDNPGYINDPSRGADGINRSIYTGGRASFLWEPTDKLTIRLSALYQKKSYDDSGDEDVEPGTLKPINGDLTQERLIGQPGFTENQVYNATINYDAGFAKILSTTSILRFRSQFVVDFSGYLGQGISQLLGGNYGGAVPDKRYLNGVSQEIRVSSERSGPLQWQFGVFYMDQKVGQWEADYPINAANGQIITNGPVNLGLFPSTDPYQEEAGFANLDYNITRTLDVAVGGRISHNNQNYTQNFTGVYGGNNQFSTPSSDTVGTYSADLRWHFLPRDTFYLRVASGYVPGGPNDISVLTQNVPHSYAPSTTVNYEAGVKTTLLDGRLTANLSVFDIEWKDLQLYFLINGTSAIGNGGAARSRGAEWEFDYVPIHGLTLNFNGAYTDAYLTANTPSDVGGSAGDRLPNNPKWQSSASARYERPITDRYTGFVGASWRYQGSRLSDFVSGGARENIPAYNMVDLRGGVEWDNFTFTVYAKNVGNTLALGYVRPYTSLNTDGPLSAAVLPPRMIGAEVSAKF
ncbi:MAG: TonB-dependent receptor [Caulobacteraceae bacterium]